MLGTQRTFLTFALIGAIVAALGLRPRWALVPVAIAALLALPVGITKAADRGQVIHEADTEYQYARVVELEDGERRLELNEGLAVHSVYRPDTVLTDNVWDGYLIEPFTVATEPPERIAILGNGAGTTARAYEEFFPATRVDGVEIDGELHEIGKRFFGLRERPQLHLYTEDARPFLRRIDARYDAIFVDAYHQPYIPFYLATVEFFELVKEKLAPGGVVIVNVGHPEGSDELEKVLSATVGEVFPHVRRDPLEEVNTLLVASEVEPSADTLRRATPGLPPDLQPIARATAARLAAPLPGGDVFTDDRAPVEWLIDASIVEEATSGGD
jgi:spermidine synthase